MHVNLGCINSTAIKYEGTSPGCSVGKTHTLKHSADSFESKKGHSKVVRLCFVLSSACSS